MVGYMRNFRFLSMCEGLWGLADDTILLHEDPALACDPRRAADRLPPWSSGNARQVGICEFESQQEYIFLLISVAESVRTLERKVQSLVDEVKECCTCIAIKIRRREPGRGG